MKKSYQKLLIIAIICVLAIGTIVYTFGGNRLSGTYFYCELTPFRYTYAQTDEYIKFIGRNKIEMFDSGLVCHGTYKLKGNVLQISCRVLGMDFVETFTVSPDFKSFENNKYLYEKK